VEQDLTQQIFAYSYNLVYDPTVNSDLAQVSFFCKVWFSLLRPSFI